LRQRSERLAAVERTGEHRTEQSLLAAPNLDRLLRALRGVLDGIEESALCGAERGRGQRGVDLVARQPREGTSLYPEAKPEEATHGRVFDAGQELRLELGERRAGAAALERVA